MIKNHKCMFLLQTKGGCFLKQNATRPDSSLRLRRSHVKQCCCGCCKLESLLSCFHDYLATCCIVASIVRFVQLRIAPLAEDWRPSGKQYVSCQSITPQLCPQQLLLNRFILNLRAMSLGEKSQSRAHAERCNFEMASGDHTAELQASLKPALGCHPIWCNWNRVPS